MKVGQLMNIVRNIFLQKSCQNEVGRLVPDLFLFLKAASCKAKANG